MPQSIEAKREALMRLLREKIERVRSYPLSPAQQRLWFLDQLQPGNAAYNISDTLRLRGELHVDAVRASFDEIVRRHEALRTRFSTRRGVPMQEVWEPALAVLPITDLSSLSPGERESAALAIARTEALTPFDLAAQSLWRARLVRLAGKEHLLIMTVHHIVADGWSMGVLQREFGACYDAFATGVSPRLPPQLMQYSDYAEWQRCEAGEGSLRHQLEYWEERLRDAPVSEIPADRPRPPIQSYCGSSMSFGLGEELTASLRKLGCNEGATLFMVLLAGFKILLSRYSGRSDVVVGTSTANRSCVETEGLVGFLANTLALRTDLSGEPIFRELLARVRNTVLDAQAHQDVPFDKLVERLVPARDLSRTPLFQVLFTLESFSDTVPAMRGLDCARVVVPSDVSMFDLTVTVSAGADDLAVTLEYCRDLFEEVFINRLAGHYRNLLAAIALDPTLSIAGYPLITTAERRSILEDFNQTAREYAGASDIPFMFRQQCGRTPDAPAVQDEKRSLTYMELDTESNRLARLLTRLGAGPECRVGICAERSVELLVGLVAILKSGAAYVPLDPEYPRARLNEVVQDAAIEVVLAQSRWRSKLPESGIVPVSLDDDLAWRGESDQDPDVEKDPRSIAYVIYTSGSTGRPKGVMNTHGGLTNRLLWMQEAYTAGTGDRVLQKTPFTFDVSVWEFFWPLITGACVVMARPGEHRDAGCIVRCICDEAITIVHFVPSMFSAFLEEPGSGQCYSLRHIVCSGEALEVEDVARFARKGLSARLHNLYGPTEAAIDVSYWECSPAPLMRTVPIGKPIANIRLYVLDSRLEPVPAGLEGELYIGGIGVARGYLNRPDLTADRFLPDPHGPPGERIYRTGDRARWGAGGNVEYLGRTDAQVKIRGRRIELGEVESVLKQRDGLKQAAVIVREDQPGDKRLTAYLVWQAGSEVDANDLRRSLTEKLPDYMIPSAFVSLQELPLTPNGKLDRKALPLPITARREDQICPRTPVEEILCGVWGELLRVERVGVEDNFFDLGGHSLIATQVVARVRTALQCELTVQALFEYPTVAGLARKIAGKGPGATPPPLTVAPRQGAMPLSYAQRRLWFLNELEPGNRAYNIAEAVRLQGQLNWPAMQSTLQALVERHEVLRTRFPTRAAEPLQEVAEAGRVPLPVIDLERLGKPEREAVAISLAGQDAAQAFDLATGPLIRTSIVRLSETINVLLVSMHHIASDGWSLGVFVREMEQYYSAFLSGSRPDLPALPVQYADFAIWQRAWLQNGVFERQMEYWRTQLASAPVLQLPTDRPRQEITGFRGAAVAVTLDEMLTRGLRELSRREGVSLFMVLLAAFQTLLQTLSGQDDIVVGTDIANRNVTGTEHLIGFFVNQLVLRTDLSGPITFRDLLKRVKRVALDAYANQDVPFERLVEELKPKHDRGYSPFFRVKLVLQNTPEGNLKLPGLQADLFRIERGISRFDWLVTFWEDHGILRGEFEYNLDLFAAPAAEAAAHVLRCLLRTVALRPSSRLEDLRSEVREYLDSLAAEQQVEAVEKRTAKLAITKRQRIRVATTGGDR